MSDRRRHPAKAATLIAIFALMVGCGEDTEPQEPTPSTVTTAVYFMAETRTGPRLVREMREVVDTDPAAAAVKLMIEGPTDPDYFSPWNTAAVVRGIATSAGAVEVNLSPDARTANIGSAGAALMIQQLVYTVTDATDPSAAVTLLIDGEPAGELWGAVSWDEPVTREAEEDVRQLVQVDYPIEGATVDSPVNVEGDAAVFEANLPWRILDEDGAPVEVGFTMTEEGQRFAPFSFSVDLEPGRYIVEITEDDPSGGEGGEPMSDTRTITVR